MHKEEQHKQFNNKIKTIRIITNKNKKMKMIRNLMANRRNLPILEINKIDIIKIENRNDRNHTNLEDFFDIYVCIWIY